jgi:hypothetical protein
MAKRLMKGRLREELRFPHLANFLEPFPSPKEIATPVASTDGFTVAVHPFEEEQVLALESSASGFVKELLHTSGNPKFLFAVFGHLSHEFAPFGEPAVVQCKIDFVE